MGMPTYQYLCRNCEHRFDIVQSIHDDPLVVCPECAGTVRRVLHPVGVTFKGSGFYRTDSRDSDSKKSAAAKPAEGKDAKASPATAKPSESAPAATTPSSSSATTTTTGKKGSAADK